MLTQLHWLTRFDEDTGEPYGQICACHIGVDHNGLGELIDPDDDDEPRE